MLEKLKTLFVKYYDLITYLVFGVLTTAVHYIVYWPCLNLLHLSASVSDAIAWVVAVAFAFLTNKPFVFRSHDWSSKVFVPELVKFVGSRIGSGVLGILILFVTVDILHWNGNLWWIIKSVAVVILNYVGSKLLVFRKK